jgi:hypothetical protein
MAQKKKKKPQKPKARTSMSRTSQIIMMVIGIFIILSMVISLVSF